MDKPRPMTPNRPAIDSSGNGFPLSLAFVSPAWPPDAFANGVIPYIDKVASELRRQGHQAKILTERTSGEVDESTILDVRPYEASDNLLTRTVDRLAYRFSSMLGARRQYTRALIKKCNWLIDEQGLQLLEMEESFGLAYWVRRKLPIPVVVRLHGPWFLNGSLQGSTNDALFRSRVRAEGLAIAHADLITSPSLDVLERTRAYYGLPLKGAVVFPPPTTMVPEADRWRVADSDPDLVLFVGRFDRHKGGDLMIEAFAEVAKRRPQARLRFVGPDAGFVDETGQRLGIMEYIGRKAPEAANRIEWLGRMPNSELGKLRREARVTVVCSRYETFGLTLTESITTGCPTVATQAGAFPEILQDGVNGLLCVPEDPRDLAEKITTLLSDEARAVRLGRRAGLDGEQRYRADAIVRELSQHYHEVIQARGRPSVGASPR